MISLSLCDKGWQTTRDNIMQWKLSDYKLTGPVSPFFLYRNDNDWKSKYPKILITIENTRKYTPIADPAIKKEVQDIASRLEENLKKNLSLV